MITYPNQKIIHINKETTTNFLQVDKEDWMKACNELTYNAFKVYLYLAGNQDGFDLALSKKALQDEIKMSNNTYTNVIKELTEKNYIVHKQGNIYDFYTIPQSDGIPQCNGIPQSTGVVYPNTVGDDTPIEWGSIPQSTGGEIDKRDKKDIFYISESEQGSSSLGADAPAATLPSEKKDRKRTLEELNNEELLSLKDDYESEVKYPELYEKYNIRKGQLDKTLVSKIDTILSDRKKQEKKDKIKSSLSQEEKNELFKFTRFTTDELCDALSQIKVEYTIAELIMFLEDEDCIFDYKSWLSDEEGKKWTYLDWFVMGVNNSLSHWWD